MSQFMSQSMTREAALRIGLAARELEIPTLTKFVTALADHIGLPLTESKLGTLTVADLDRILIGEQANECPSHGVERETLKRAVRLLWGEGVVGSELPSVDTYLEGEMPGSIRVACASDHGETIDGHFGSCERFLIYQVAPTELRLIALRPTLEADHDEDDRNAARARLISDCQVLYIQSIGGPAAAKVVRAGIHPVKIPAAAPARTTLARLQETLHHPPPWLAKVMGVKAQSLEKFAAMV